MEKLNFDIEKYQSLTPDEKVEALSKIFFKYLDEGLIVENAPEELIENIYDETIYKITNLFRSEQGEIDYEITSYEDGGFLYYSKIRNNYISEIDYRKLKNLPNSFRFKFQFRKKVYGENKGTIDTQTIGYKVFSNFRNSVKNRLQPKNGTDNEPLTTKQIEKVGLFVRSGIVQFLRDRNPDLKDSDISKFIRELTSEYLENSEGLRPHLTTNLSSSKHPFYANGRKDSLDLILNKYKINPQSDS